MSNDRSKLIIERTSQWNNRLRSSRIFLDGVEVDSVQNGATNEFAISPGSHEIFAKIDWCATRPLKFTIGTGETKTFRLGSDIKGFKLLAALYYILLDTKNYIYLREK